MPKEQFTIDAIQAKILATIILSLGVGPWVLMMVKHILK